MRRPNRRRRFRFLTRSIAVVEAPASGRRFDVRQKGRHDCSGRRRPSMRVPVGRRPPVLSAPIRSAPNSVGSKFLRPPGRFPFRSASAGTSARPLPCEMTVNFPFNCCISVANLGSCSCASPRALRRAEVTRKSRRPGVGSEPRMASANCYLS